VAINYTHYNYLHLPSSIKWEDRKRWKEKRSFQDFILSFAFIHGDVWIGSDKIDSLVAGIKASGIKSPSFNSLSRVVSMRLNSLNGPVDIAFVTTVAMNIEPHKSIMFNGINPLIKTCSKMFLFFAVKSHADVVIFIKSLSTSNTHPIWCGYRGQKKAFFIKVQHRNRCSLASFPPFHRLCNITCITTTEFKDH
jgi:hypothetical protein